MASEWINVKERLPEPGVSVLTFNGFVAVNSIDQGENPPDWGGGWDDRPRPTHWMPLPPPPATTLTVEEALREAIDVLNDAYQSSRACRSIPIERWWDWSDKAYGLLPRLRAALEGEE